MESCRLVSQSNEVKNSIKDCDWRIVLCFITEKGKADATFATLEIKGSLEPPHSIGID